MYCPSCGNPNAENRNFCTSCGMALETVSQAVAAGRALPESDLQTVPQGKLPFWQSPLIYGAFLSAFGFFITSAGIFAFHNPSVTYLGEVIAGLGATLIFFRGVLQLVLMLKAEETPAPSIDRKRTGRPRQSGAAQTPLLTPQIPSVTENTTRQLEVAIERESRGTAPAPNTQPNLS